MSDFGLVGGESLLEALDLGCEALNGALLLLHEVKQLLDGESALLGVNPRLTNIHPSVVT